MPLADALREAGQSLAKTSDSARLDAEVLCAFVLGVDRTGLLLDPTVALGRQQRQRFQQLIERRRRGEPIAYLIGQREFWSLAFTVTPAVLIPRPESELLVERALLAIDNIAAKRVLDLGTGSGAVAISIAAERPALDVTATDVSAAALEVAAQNARKHGVKNMSLIQSGWFGALEAMRYDVIVSNPPYIAPGDPHLARGDVRYEPRQALVAADAGLADLKSIIDDASEYLNSGGYLLLEHGFDQGSAVRAHFAYRGYTAVETVCDLAGRERVTLGKIGE